MLQEPEVAVGLSAFTAVSEDGDYSCSSEENEGDSAGEDSDDSQEEDDSLAGNEDCMDDNAGYAGTKKIMMDLVDNVVKSGQPVSYYLI